MKKVTLIAIICCLAGLFLMLMTFIFFKNKSIQLWSGKGGTQFVEKTFKCNGKIDDIDIDITGKNILIIEDILDTGKTLHTVRAMLLEKGAASVEIATLLNKQERREYPIQAKYVGFEIPNAFVIGYGMDYDEKYRNLPYVGILKEEVYAQ